MTQSPQPPTNSTTVLPFEIWTHIFSFLPATEIKRLKLVHRACYQLARTLTWKTLQLAYFDEVGGPPNKKIKGCLKSPVLAGQVRHLLIQEQSVLHQDPTTTMHGSVSLWVKTHTVLPLKRLQQKRKHNDGLVNGSLRAVSHLTHRLDEMTINFYWPPYAQKLSQHRQLFYEQLFTLLAHETLTSTPRVTPIRFRSLVLKVQLHHLPIIAKWFSLSPGIFDELEHLSFGIGVTNRHTPMSLLPPSDNETVARDTRAVIDYLRKSVRKFSVICYERLRQKPGFFNALGHFPQLVSLELECPVTLVRSASGSVSGGHVDFFMRHRATLEHLCLGSVSMTDATNIIFPPSDSNSSTTASPLPRLSTLGLFLLSKDVSQHIPFRNQFLAQLSRFSDTLTTLVLDMHFHRLVYEDVQRLVKSLYKPLGGVLLKRLKITLADLCPETVDVLSEYLNNLVVLDLTIGTLSGSRTRPAISNLEPDFFDVMVTRHYPNWTSLKCVAVQCKSPASLRLIAGTGTSNMQRPQLQKRVLKVLARQIPSISDFGPIDWSSVGSHWKFFSY